MMQGYWLGWNGHCVMNKVFHCLGSQASGCSRMGWVIRLLDNHGKSVWGVGRGMS